MKHRKTMMLVAIGLIALLMIPSVYADAAESSKTLKTAKESFDLLPELDEQEIEDLIEKIEEQGEPVESEAGCYWVVLTKGRSWEIESIDPTNEVAPPAEYIPMGMILVAQPVLATNTGETLYRIRGFVIHDGRWINVFGAAVLWKGGFFAMKLDGEGILRLFAVGRVHRTGNRCHVRMRGWMELDGTFFAFIQRGKAYRMCFTPPPSLTP